MRERGTGLCAARGSAGKGHRERAVAAGDAHAGRRAKTGADARNRTEDPIITSDVLCQLSYVGSEEALGF
jgi:hypothetical protein